MSYTFAKAMGGTIGNSICELDKLDLAKSILEKAEAKGVKIHLPEDTVCAKECVEGAETITVPTSEIPDEWEGLDIGPKSIEKFLNVIKEAKTVIWNGPMGFSELSTFANGTIEVAKALAANEEAVTIIGGGDSAAAVEKFGMSDKMTHVSTGGGASLEFIEGKVLPGIDALNNK